MTVPLLVTSLPRSSPWPENVARGAGCGEPRPAQSLASHTHTLPSRPPDATSPPGSALSAITPLTRALALVTHERGARHGVARERWLAREDADDVVHRTGQKSRAVAGVRARAHACALVRHGKAEEEAGILSSAARLVQRKGGGGTLGLRIARLVLKRSTILRRLESCCQKDVRGICRCHDRSLDSGILQVDSTELGAVFAREVIEQRRDDFRGVRQSGSRIALDELGARKLGRRVV